MAEENLSTGAKRLILRDLFRFFTSYHMSETLRIIIIHEDEGFGCGCLDDLDFLLLGPTVADIKARLPKALEDHFGRPVAYRIVSQPEGDRLH